MMGRISRARALREMLGEGIGKWARKARSADSIHLQGIGEHPAKPAGELRPGDTIVWNFGITGKVLSVTPRGSQISTSIEGEDGKTYARRFNKTRLVAVE